MKKIYESPMFNTMALEKSDVLTLSDGTSYSGDNVSYSKLLQNHQNRE